MNLCLFFKDHNIQDKETKHQHAIDRIKTIFKNLFFQQEVKKGDVMKMFRIVDKIFFGNAIQKIIRKNNIAMHFSVSAKLTSTAGYCQKYNDHKYKITLSLPVTRKLFIDTNNIQNQNLQYHMGGIVCRNKVECIYHVMCHEIIHLINMIECNDLVETVRGHTGIFKKMVYNIFGHTNCHHSLHIDVDTMNKKKKVHKEKQASDQEMIKNKFGNLIKVGNILIARAGKKELSGTIISVGMSRIKIHSNDGKMWFIPYQLIINITEKSD